MDRDVVVRSRTDVVMFGPLPIGRWVGTEKVFFGPHLIGADVMKFVGYTCG
jgi:hypothetical protein